MIVLKIRNVFGNRYRGALGKDMIASSWKGHDYIKEYRAPTNPRTERQTKVRTIFSKALDAWRNLDTRQREFYDKMAEGMSGYNLFVGRYIRAVNKGEEPEFPLQMEWKTPDGGPVNGCWLIIRHGAKQLFADSLKNGKGEIALTPSDVPYLFVLSNGTEEDRALMMENLSSASLPFTIESVKLGIKTVVSKSP